MSELLSKPTITIKPQLQREVLLLLGWYAEAIHRGVARYAHAAGWALDASQGRALRPPAEVQSDGLICVMGLDTRIDRLALRTNAPVVNIGYSGKSNIPTVMADQDKIAGMAVDYFVNRGFKHLAFYMVSGSVGEEGRMRAFAQHAKKRSAVFHLMDCRQGGPGPGDSRRVMRQLARQLRLAPKPLAAMAEYDDLALHIMKACAAENIGVPEQVAILGVNNDALRCPFATIPLSSIDDDLEGIGYKAAEILDGLMQGHKPTQSVTLIPPLGVTTRHSTDILAIEHPWVARMLKLIWQNYQQSINIGVLAEEIPMSYRRLHDAFVKHVGRTMADELRRRRIEHAAKMLLETNAKLHQIADTCGFADVNRLVKSFRKERGMTPGQFRKSHPR